MRYKTATTAETAATTLRNGRSADRKLPCLGHGQRRGVVCGGWGNDDGDGCANLMKLSVRIVFHSLTVNAGSQDGGGGSGGRRVWPGSAARFPWPLITASPQLHVYLCMYFAVSFFLRVLSPSHPSFLLLSLPCCCINFHINSYSLWLIIGVVIVIAVVIVLPRLPPSQHCGLRSTFYSE